MSNLGALTLFCSEFSASVELEMEKEDQITQIKKIHKISSRRGNVCSGAYWLNLCLIVYAHCRYEQTIMFFSRHTVVEITLLNACFSSEFSGRFDLEKNQAQEELQKERNQREKLARDRDMLAGEMFTLRQQLEVRTKIEKCVSLSHVLEQDT